jgi:broad specificity phosphatase PhoE
MTLPTPDAARRRLYIMRHGSVTYFDEATGTIADAQQVPLNAQGRDQASAAGYAFLKAGVQFDRVITSGLPRTVETARRVLVASRQQALNIEQNTALQEIRGGKLSAIPPQELHAAFVGAIDGLPSESHRFLGGESVGELLDRVLPCMEALRANAQWDCALLVLHGGVNRALLSYLATGQRMFIGGLAQAPACINAVDVGSAKHDVVVRMLNYAPTSVLHTHTRKTTMEQLYEQFVNVQTLLKRNQ